MFCINLFYNILIALPLCLRAVISGNRTCSLCTEKNNIVVTIVVLLYRLYVNWRFLRGIEAQFLALQKGFNEVIPQHLLKTFDEKELEVSLLIINVFLLYA